MAVNHNQRTIKLLNEMGYTCEVVERWCGFSRKKHDLFTIFDVLAIGNNETVGIQITSRSNMSTRVKKIADSEFIDAIREANWRILVIGWDKPAHRYRHKIVDIS
jgi:hypothetical protein